MTDKQNKIALFRYGLISHVIHSEHQSRCFKELATKSYDVPYLGMKRFKPGTFKKWLLLFRKYGLDGLKPKPRVDKDTFKSINAELENIIKSFISDYQIV